MPLWGPRDEANSAPKWGCDLVPSGGSGNANRAANNVALYNNSTLGRWVSNETDSMIYVTPSMITGGIKVSGGPGWYFKRQGSGGRASRVSYEALAVFSPFGGAMGPVTPAWPDATNTGYRAGLTVFNGDVTTTADGQIISGLDITGGGVIVQHNNVTIRDCKIHGALYGVNDTTGSPHSGLKIQHCEIYDVFTGIAGGGLIEYNNIHDCENGISVSGLDGVVIQHNYIHKFTRAGDPHYDGIELYARMNGVTIYHNVIELDQGFTGTINMTPTYGPINNVLIDNNKLSGGSFTVYMINGGTGLELTNVTLTNNIFGIGAFGLYSIVGMTPTMSGNITNYGWYIDGQIPPVEGTVVFSPSTALGDGEVNINPGFRLSALLAANVGSDVRIVLRACKTGAMRLQAAGFGKVSSGGNATGVLTAFTFGGSTAPPVDVNQNTYIVSDWIPKGALTLSAGDRMLIGLKLGNAGITFYIIAGSVRNGHLRPPDCTRIGIDRSRLERTQGTPTPRRLSVPDPGCMDRECPPFNREA